jgi:hypothetical protein
VPHQFFASSALPSMFIRGTLGWDPDASAGRARLAPQLPPEWERLEVRNLAVGSELLDVKLERGAGSARLELAGSGAVELEWDCAIPAGARNVRATRNGTPIQIAVVEGTHDGVATIVIPPGESVRVAEVTWDGGLEVAPPLAAPRPGEESRGVRILDFRASGDGWRLQIEGPAGSDAEIGVIGEPVRVAGVVGWTPFGTETAGAATTGTVTATGRQPETARTTLSVNFPDGIGRSRLDVHLAPGS